MPTIDKVVDAWDARGDKPYLIYGNTKSPFKALPVARIRLTVGDVESVKPVGNGETSVTFYVPLEQMSYKIKAEMLDAENQVIAGAYYVYCRRTEPGR